MANEFRVKNGLITPAVLSEETDGKIVLTRLDADTGDDKGVILAFETKEQNIEANDVLGKITFAAPDEGTGTDALLVAGAISVVSEGDFSGSSNASKMLFQTGASETATTKMAISSGGQVTATAGLNATSTTTGTVKVTGGVGISHNLYAGGATRFTANTASSSTTTGTLVVTGGTGISEDLYVGADAYIGDNLALTSDAARLIMGGDGEVSFRHEADNGFSIYTPSVVAKPIALKLMNENAGATGAVLRFHKDSSSLAANDKMGHIEFSSTDNDDADMLYGQIRGISSDITDEHELGVIQLQVRSTSGDDTTHLIEGLTVAGTNPGSLGDGGVRVTIGGENAGDAYTGVTESPAGSAITGIIHPTDKTSTFNQYNATGGGTLNQQLQQPAFNIGGGIVPYEYTTVAKQLTGGTTAYITPKYLANLYVNATGYSEARISSVSTQTESHSVSSLGTALVLETAGEQNNLGVYWTRNRNHTEYSWINADTSAALTNGDFTWGMGPAAVDSTTTLFALNEMVWGYSGDDYNAVMGKGLTSLNSTSTHPLDLPIMALGTGGGLYLKEQAAAAADRAAYGQLWVDDAVPNALYFTNDAGTDIQITSGSSLAGSGGSLSGLGSTANVLMRVSGTGGQTAKGSGILVDDSDNMSGIGTISSGAITATGTSTFATAIEPDADDGATIGSANKNWSDVFLADSAVLNFGDDQDTTLTHTDGSGLTLNSTNKLMFGDSASYIHQSADGVLDLVSDTEIELTGPTLDLNASTAVTIDTPSITITDSTTSSATEGGFIRLVSDDGAAMANDHRLGVIEFAGAEDASNTITVGARIEAVCDAGWSASENGAALVMYTTDANASQSEVLRLDSDKLATFAGDVTILGDFNITGDINSTSVTDLDVTDKTITIANGAGDSAAADGAGIVVGGAAASLLYDHTGTQWEFNKNVEFAGHILPNADDTYDIGSASLAWQDLFLEGDITLTDAGTLSTSAGALTITAAAASTWSTSSGALTLTSAAACTWSAAAGNLTLDSAAGTANLDGHTGVQITSSNSGNIDLDSAVDIVLDSADDKHIIFQQAGVSYLSIGQGTTAIDDIEDSAGATVIDAFACNTFQAVKYLVLVEDVTANDEFLTAELMVLGDASVIDGSTKPNAYMTTYAVVHSNTELGTFSATGNANNSDVINLVYTPRVATGGTLNHKVRVVAQRIASIS